MGKTVAVIERAIDILDAIRNQGGQAGVSEIGREIGLPKSTVQRILATLAQKGVVNQDTQTALYSIGYKVIELAFSASKLWDLASMATPYLDELRDCLNETAGFVVRSGWEYVFMAQAVVTAEYRFTINLGMHRHLNWGAAGKAILAFLPDDELQEYLNVGPLTPRTPKTITDPAILRTQLERVRELGYAVSIGESVDGFASISAPICDRQGLAFAAVCIVGPDIRVQKMDLKAAGDKVAQIGKKIEVVCRPILHQIA